MSILPVASVINLFRVPGGITVSRRGGATADADGNPVRGPADEFIVDPAAVQPLTGRDLLRLPDGDRALEHILVHAKTTLRTARAASGQEADEILWREPTPTAAGTLCGTYVVTQAADWQVQGGFTRAICTKKEGDAP